MVSKVAVAVLLVLTKANISGNSKVDGLCCSFLIVPSVYFSVYFVLCLVYPMLSVSMCCLYECYYYESCKSSI